jgi:hypothetical protein
VRPLTHGFDQAAVASTPEAFRCEMQGVRTSSGVARQTLLRCAGCRFKHRGDAN